MISYSFFRHSYCYPPSSVLTFLPLPNPSSDLFLPFPFPITFTLLFSSLLHLSFSHGPLILSWLLDYARLYTQIWRFEVKSHNETEKKRKTFCVCFSGTGLTHSYGIFYFHPFSCKFCDFTFLYSCIVFYSVYAPHFHYSFLSWRTFGMVPFPCSCE